MTDWFGWGVPIGALALAAAMMGAAHLMTRRLEAKLRREAERRDHAPAE